MKRFQNCLLLFAFAVLALHPLLHAQIRELGTGALGPVKASHVTAELIAAPTTIAVGGSGHVALSLTLEPGRHVYWVYAGDSGTYVVVPAHADGTAHVLPEFLTRGLVLDVIRQSGL